MQTREVQARKAQIRKARKQDALHLAKLINLAGDGIPFHLWQQMKASNETTLEFGTRRAARDEGGFSYKHAWVAELESEVASMILGYPQPDPYDLDDLDEYPVFLQPIVELEALAPGSWYINAIATFEQFRQHGIGSRLINFAETIAADEGCQQLSLIVSSANSNAERLYENLGFGAIAQKEIIPVPGFTQSGNWVLMVKQL